MSGSNGVVNDPEAAKRVADYAAYVGGTGGSLAATSEIAGHLTPILSALFIFLSILWLFWRAFDRVKHGPRRGSDE